MAKKMKGISDDELIGKIKAEIEASENTHQGTIATARADSNYANANQNTSISFPKDNLSSIPFFVTPKITRTLVAYSSDTFLNGKKETIKFNPVQDTPEAKKGAQQLQMAVNSIIHKDNDPVEIFNGGFRSAAVNKNAFWKTSWSEEKDISMDMYKGTREELNAHLFTLEEKGYDEIKITDSELIEEIEYEDIQIDPLTGEQYSMYMSESTYEFTIRMVRMKGKISIDLVPPERMDYSREADSFTSPIMGFTSHTERMFSADVKARWPKSNEDGYGTIHDERYDYAQRVRDDIAGNNNELGYGDNGQMPKVDLSECWIRADRDGDGYPEWRHCFLCGTELLEDELWNQPLPVTTYTYFPIAHELDGQSVYDRAYPSDLALTGLMRSELNTAVKKNTERGFYKSGTVLDEDELDSGRSGWVEVDEDADMGNMFTILPVNSGANNSQLIFQEIGEHITADFGINIVNGQISADAAKSGVDATKTAMVIDNASVKVKEYDRRFAEGPMKDIAWSVVSLLVKYKDTPYVKELIESLTPGVPFIAGEMGIDNILTKSSLTSTVGLGYQTGEQRRAASTQVFAMIQTLEQNPSPAYYAIIKEVLEGSGYQNPEDIIGPLDFYKQKKQDMDAKAQQAMQLQSQELAIKQQEVAQTGQYQTAQIELANREQSFKEQSQLQVDQARMVKFMESAGLDKAKAENIVKEYELEKTKVQADIQLSTQFQKPFSIG